MIDFKHTPQGEENLSLGLKIDDVIALEFPYDKLCERVNDGNPPHRIEHAIARSRDPYAPRPSQELLKNFFYGRSTEPELKKYLDDRNNIEEIERMYTEMKSLRTEIDTFWRVIQKQFQGLIFSHQKDIDDFKRILTVILRQMFVCPIREILEEEEGYFMMWRTVENLQRKMIMDQYMKTSRNNGMEIISAREVEI